MQGIEHLWRNHKELFADPDQAVQILRETLGNENCRVVVSLKRASEKVHNKALPKCLKIIVLHNSRSKCYCVMVFDDKTNELRKVSWHKGPPEYGNEEWSLDIKKLPAGPNRGSRIHGKSGKYIITIFLKVKVF